MTVAPKSRTRLSSAERSTVDSQLEIWSATSLPIPSTLRSSVRFAARICCGSLKTSSSFRSRSSAGTTTQQLHALAHHAKFGSFLPGLFIVPRIQLQTAFDEHRPPFLQILPGDFCRSAPECNIDERRFLAPFSAVGGVNA